MYCSLNSRYNDAIKQLNKGKELFDKILHPLVHLLSDWRHVGLVCLPNIQSRDQLPKGDKKVVEMCQCERKNILILLEQIVLTEEEINDQACHWLSDILKEEEEDIVDRDGDERSEDYKNLISLLLGSHHAHYMKPVEDVLPRTLDFSSKEGEKTKKRLGKILVLIGRIASLICNI